VGEWIHSIGATNTIQVRYQADRVLAPLGLKVETSRREVFISGLVQNDAQRARAVAVARETSGVVAAYFVETDLPGRPVSRAHYRASGEAVWAATLVAVRGAGYQIEERRDGRALVTAWRRLDPAGEGCGAAPRSGCAWPSPHAESVTVIAVSDLLDESDLSGSIDREEAVLHAIQEALAPTALSRW
jgi:hypothetical protein